jgi:hypothetical protein
MPTWLKEITMYKGELEEGSDWTPVFPKIFLELDLEKVTAYGAGNKSAKTIDGLNVYIVDKDTDEPVVLPRLEEVIEYLDGKEMRVQLDTTVTAVKLKYEGFQLHAYLKGGPLAYLIRFSVI